MHINSLRMKEINLRTILNNIRKFGPISRKELISVVGLTNGTITNITYELLNKGYIMEVGTGESAGGRKPIMLEINPKAGYVLGLELNASQATCVLTDFKPNILKKETMDIHLEEGKESVIDKVVGLIEKVLDTHEINRDMVKGIGFVSAGPYDHEKGVMINPPNFPGWHNVPIADIIQERTGIKTYFERDSAASGMADYWLGHIDSPECILSISIFSIGIGGGIIMNGKIFRGFMDGACEVGHIQVERNGETCTCGNIGCLEIMADGDAALRYAKEAIKNGAQSRLNDIEEVSINDVIRAAEEGDATARDAVIKCADYIGSAVSDLMNITSPNIVILGGDFVLNSNLLFENIKSKAKERNYPKSKEYIEIKRTEFGEYSRAMGGVAVVFERLSRV